MQFERIGENLVFSLTTGCSKILDTSKVMTRNWARGEMSEARIGGAIREDRIEFSFWFDTEIRK